MATAEQLRSELELFLARNGLKYQLVDEADNQLALFFTGDAADTYIVVDFDEEENDACRVHFASRPAINCQGAVPNILQWCMWAR